MRKKMGQVGVLFVALNISSCRHPTPPNAEAKPTANELAKNPPVLIKNVRVFDGERVITSTDVLLANGLIERVEPSLFLTTGTNVVDGAGKTLLPGLIDAHCHTWTYEQLKQAAVFGVTTELDMMGPASTTKALKEGILSGKHGDLADLRAAGYPFTVPNGHGTEFGFLVPTVTDPKQAQAFIVARVSEGSDYIKMMFDSGVAWGQKRPTLSLALLDAGIRAAHNSHRLALVHAGTSEEALTAVRLGPDGIEHVWTDKTPPELLREIVARHLFVVPTLSVLLSMAGEHPGDELVTDPSLSPYLSQSMMSKLYANFSIEEAIAPADLMENVHVLNSNQVPLFVGTDGGNAGVAHGVSMHGELRLLVEAGLSPRDALKAATASPAKAFGLADRGRIVPGARADVLLVDGDPTTNILDTRRISAVYLRGKPVDREGYRASIAKRTQKRLPPAPPRMLGDFEPPLSGTGYGNGWIASTDSYRGGNSKTTLNIIGNGAEGSANALLLSGSVVPSHITFPWSGALYYAGQFPMQPVDLSSFEKLTFFAKGDGNRYQIMLFIVSETAPQIQTFIAGSNWEKHEFELRRFGTLGHGIKGIFFGTGRIGDYQFSLDRVVLE
jgi:imidazolonepropionase-like amidohydrolase